MKRISLKIISLFAVVQLLHACGGGDNNNTDELPLSTFQVDTTLQPSAASLPGFNGTDSRPLAAMSDENGNVVDFVSNELWVSTEDNPTLDALVVRLNAEVLLRIDETTIKIPNFPSQALIRVDVSAMDASNLAENARLLSATSRGDITFSSEEGLKLLAVSAQESVNGIVTGLNYVGKSTALNTQTRESYEAPTGPGGYDNNAFNWSHLNSGSTQDIGVTDAWRALDAAGKLTPGSVKLAILDMGFAPDADFPAGGIAISNVPFKAPTNTESIGDCGDGNPCPWHGTNVVGAAMGVPGNDYGAAGPAGPVARPILIYTYYDFGTSMFAIYRAADEGARIINMSYSAKVPVYLAWSVAPFDISTRALRNAGVLLVASAGNGGEDGKGDNVDSSKCFLGSCWERYWYTPCENDGVMCIGGLKANSKSRDPGSNYGSEHVDLFAPFTVFVGPDPQSPAGEAQTKHGTSFSSPFVAGVAALILAADPSLSGNEIEAILLDTAHTSPDDDTVGRYVNARAAVRAVLGNIPPSIQLESASGNRQLNHSIYFFAATTDFEDGSTCCDVTWTSNIDGVLHVGKYSFNHTFTTTGTRVISASVTDSVGAITTKTINLNIINTAPTVTITKPIANEEIIGDFPYIVRGTSYDTNETGYALPCSSMQWTSSNSGDLLGIGCDLSATFISIGARTLTLTGTDSEGSTSIDTVGITIIARPVNLPPLVMITSPENGSSLFASSSFNSPVSLTATVSDDNDALADLSYVWTVTYLSTTTTIGSTKDISWIPSTIVDFSSGGFYDFIFKLTVTDVAGSSNSDSVKTSDIIIN